MMWTGRTGRGLIKIHMLPTGQTLTPENYFNQMLEKEVKPLTSRRHMKGSLIERKFFSSKKEATFVQAGAVAHTSKAIHSFIHSCCWTGISAVSVRHVLPYSNSFTAFLLKSVRRSWLSWIL